MKAAKSLELIRSNESLRQQLAKKDSEIELLKARIGQKRSEPEAAWPPRYGETEPHLSPEKIADGAIEMFLEYRDKHGKTEVEARACAVQEVIEGINAIEEIKAGESEFRRALGRERMAQEQLHAVIYGSDQEQGVEL